MRSADGVAPARGEAGAVERRALITGAAGFVGNVLRAYLTAQGWDVACTDLRPAQEGRSWTACDVADRDAVFDALEAVGAVTHVFHLAALTFVPRARREPERAFEVNLLGTVHLVAALRAYAPEARLVYVSSAEVYGVPQSLPLTERHPLNPGNPYAVAKAAADHYCAWCHAAEGVDVIRMRPTNHSGPGQSDRFALSSFARQIAQIEAGKKQPPVLHVGNLDAARDFLHVKDVVRAYELAALRGVSGEAYNVCSGRATPIRDAVGKLVDLARVAIRVESDPERMRPADVPDNCGAHDKLTAHTGWQPEIPFDVVLADLLSYWRAWEKAE